MLARQALPLLTALAMLGSQAVDAPRFDFHGHLHAQELPPVSYICPMDADIVDVKPGRCPTCKMVLEPVRIDLAWSCPNHAAVITASPGTCPIDRRELVQVTVSKHWTCTETKKTHLLEPGRCANGAPRKLEQAIRAHGDHNPRHGGQFFMAADKWHHLEGTYPRPGLFRVHFYDNFTKVYPAKGFVGRLVTREDGRRELAAVPLRIGADGMTMEADLPGMAAPSKLTPLRVAAKVVFKRGEPEQRFDFTFTELSSEPAAIPVPAPVVSVTMAKPEPAAPAPRPGPVNSATPTAPIAAADTVGGPRVLRDCKPTMSRNDAVAFGQTLPRASGELLRLLSLCSAEVGTLIKDGEFGLVYQPSILSKDIAIALEETAVELPNRQRAPTADAIRRVVLAAWMLDLYGDQGNREKLIESYDAFAAAVAEIKSAYGTKP